MQPSSLPLGRFSFLQLFVAVAFLSFSVSGCKKTASEDPELPTFGNCQAVSPAGHFTFNTATSEFSYDTRGGGHIRGNFNLSIVLSLDSYAGFSVTFWGKENSQSDLSGYIENLNGKHIKDRETAVRTFIFPDGTKITMTAVSKTGTMQRVSIYEQGELHHINVGCKTVEYSANNAAIAQAIDQSEPDGETSTIEVSDSELLWVNIYTENEAGRKIEKRNPLGKLVKNNPSQVIDLYVQ